MVFSSATFLFLFLPAVYILYFIVPGIKAKNVLLVIASLVFYAWGEQLYVFLMIGSVFLNWIFGLTIDRFYSKKKIIAAIAVFINLGMLFLFKYLGFFVSLVSDAAGLGLPEISIHLPIGISFFTFQILSYVIDACRNRKNVQKNFFLLLLYISLFPQLIAGPIVKYHDVSAQLVSRKPDIDHISDGLRRFIIGLSKKLLIADVMAKCVDEIYSCNPSSISGICAWTGAIFYIMQIYYDFSGYSDMAIGLGRMFGFEFRENFRYPFFSLSIREFWRRWHISLSTWFKEYLYIPLGGSRKGKARTYLNLLIVFLFTGLWHGANITFVAWGLYNGILIVLERAGIIPVDKIRFRPIKRIYTLLAVIIGFVLFRSDSITFAAQFIKTMFSPSAFALGFADASAYFNPYILTVFAAACIGSFPLIEKIKKYASGKSEKTASVIFASGYAVTCVMLICCILILSSNSYSPFIYFRF